MDKPGSQQMMWFPKHSLKYGKSLVSSRVNCHQKHGWDLSLMAMTTIEISTKWKLHLLSLINSKIWDIFEVLGDGSVEHDEESI